MKLVTLLVTTALASLGVTIYGALVDPGFAAGISGSRTGTAGASEGPRAPRHASSVRARAIPSVAEFTADFIGLTGGYAEAHGTGMRIDRVQCVAGKPGDFMCSYRATPPKGRRSCHLMQAQWSAGCCVHDHRDARGTCTTLPVGARRDRLPSLRSRSLWANRTSGIPTARRASLEMRRATASRRSSR